MSEVQAVYPDDLVHDRVHKGPVRAADVMLAGFKSASTRYSTFTTTVLGLADGEVMPKFSWRPGVESMVE